MLINDLRCFMKRGGLVLTLSIFFQISKEILNRYIIPGWEAPFISGRRAFRRAENLCTQDKRSKNAYSTGAKRVVNRNPLGKRSHLYVRVK